GQLESVRGLAAPPGKNLLVGHPIKGVVDLDRREALGVVGEHLRGGHLLRVEASPPLGIVVTGGPDPEVHVDSAVPLVAGSVPARRYIRAAPEPQLPGPVTRRRYCPRWRIACWGLPSTS